MNKIKLIERVYFQISSNILNITKMVNRKILIKNKLKTTLSKAFKKI